jgi:hypothetical protein
MLKLNGEGRYVQGPAFGKDAMLLAEHGVVEITVSTYPDWGRAGAPVWPLADGRELVAWVDRHAFEAALWIQDRHDYDRVVRALQGGDVVRWFVVDRDRFEEASRAPV